MTGKQKRTSYLNDRRFLLSGSGLRDLNPWSQLWESCMLPLHQTRMKTVDKQDYSQFAIKSQALFQQKTGLFGFPVMLERQEVQEGGEPSCPSARCPRILSFHFAAV